MVPKRDSLFHPCSRRLHVLLLCMFGVFNSTFLNINLAINMHCMVNSTAVSIIEGYDLTAIEIDVFDNKTESTDLAEGNGCSADSDASSAKKPQPIVDYGGSLLWDHNVQNLLFSAHMWGSLLGIPISLIFMQRLSPKWTFALVITIKALMNLVIPVCAIYLPYYSVFAARFLLGFGEPFIYPCINTILAAFFRMEERSTALALFTSGNQVAMVFGNQIGAAFCKSRFGWPAGFYFPGILAILWIFLWSALASNAPEDCKKMSVAERQMYNTSSMARIPSRRRNQKVPWKAILTNIPFHSHLLANVAITIVATLLMIYLPSYFKDVLHLGVMANGAYTSLPTIFNFVFKLTWGMLMDKMKRTGILTPTQGVRISQLFPTFGIAISLICLVLFANCQNPEYAFIIICFTNLCMGGYIRQFYFLIEIVFFFISVELTYPFYH
ncbi:hypothetical protein WR25_12062 isoform I [Diploscapter pachys]|uniref:Major facilitator superfamily (MFS) profile domain-containing protein n=2 Tax=Diploscapter pachys TaxID=2018661 RepID=A0A2A2LS52_9BILA|nr:hypothetical protein WR25_12062 isoform D [Diploscapter pachys]PAV88797.1 hypothetical protein WR25_12062 isoform I [Diploscapter pachys]